ncbi:MAG: Dabb family protein [Clostridium sp.]
MVKHIVMWTFKDTEEGSKEENAVKMKNMIEDLVGVIDEIKELEVGLDFNKSQAAFDLVLYSTFESKEALNAYQVHPKHQEVVKFASRVVDNRAVVDYII